jgi:hypothetical protein
MCDVVKRKIEIRIYNPIIKVRRVGVYLIIIISSNNQMIIIIIDLCNK